MNETEAFLAEILPQQRAMTLALHEGNTAPRIALWSHLDPVTLFGAHYQGSGWAELEPKIRQAADRFGGSQGFNFEVLAAQASGDLAYIAGNELTRVVIDGAPATYTLRTTHVYRREGDAWRIVHRHSDFSPGSAVVP